MDEEKIDEEYKILLLGDSTVGKTSSIIRYIDNTFDENGSSTVGVDVRYKDIFKNNKKIRLKIWDTAGQERFRSMTNNYLTGTQGIILVFDIINKESFEKLKYWLRSVKEAFPEGNVEIIIIGNKIDLKDKREISEDTIKKFGEKNNIEVFNASAKTGEGVGKAFECLINKLFNNKIIGISKVDSEIESQKRKGSFRLIKSDNNSNKDSNKDKNKC